MTHAAADPRDRITPEAFGVAPELLGLPLASPWRRAAAMLCDLVPLGILIGANVLILAIAAAITFWRASAPGAPSSVMRRGARGLLRLGAAGLAFLVVLRVSDRLFGDADDGPATVVADGDVARENVALGLSGLVRIPDIARLTSVDDTAEARESALRIADWMDDLRLSPEARREMADDLVGSMDDADARAIAAAVFGTAFAPADTVRAPASPDGASPAGLPAGDALVVAYAAAVADGDTATARALHAAAAEHLAADRIAELQDDVEDLREDRAELRRELADTDQDGGGITGFIRSIADDLGIGFGWGALYFTSFLALMGGQTPGKWLVGIRVIRLDGKPLGWWRAFERFGGYAASLSTGLLGFLQILWDRNRQGLHDKAVETVVIRVRRGDTGPPAGTVTSPPGSASPLAPR